MLCLVLAYFYMAPLTSQRLTTDAVHANPQRGSGFFLQQTPNHSGILVSADQFPTTQLFS